MTTPRDPESIAWDKQASEYDYGPGFANPANVNGVPDYGGQLPYPKLESEDANFERAVADRRTDSTDPNSERDFSSLGNPDRYGPQPPLLQSRAERQPATPGPAVKTGVTRAR